ncbi:MAG TPA: helix-turn-helix domain-containing protein [Chloroflexota bacterium]|nr:helix-turn-helix domain-containing protein [Chloroflexota bacterium]
MAIREDAAFGDLLRRYRSQAGLTQEELAERAGVSARAISDLERGTRSRPRRDTVALLADALGLDAEQRRQLAETVTRTRAVPVATTRRELNTLLALELSPLIGREHEEAAVVHLLRGRDVRIVTLTGTGGVGKTRLALRVASELKSAYHDGSAVVSLAPLRDADQALPAIASALDVAAVPHSDVNGVLREALRDREMLLVLDNCEHLPGAAEGIEQLLLAVPRLTVLATSRAPLRIRGEQEFAVAPLGIPGPDEVKTETDLARFPSCVLFLSRARAIAPALAFSDRDAVAVGEICRRLDGLPLAIELAAARTRVLPPQALAVRLGRRLPLLQGGLRDSPPRQRTLRAAIEWSYDLLPPDARRLFARLAVFPGPFDVPAAEGVCDADLDSLDLLLAQNLLGRTVAGRFFYLETIREFAEEKLEESADSPALRRRHAEYFLALVRSAHLTLEADGPMRHDLVVNEWDNVRAALDWTRAAGELTLGVELALALENFWVTSNPYEGWRRLDEMRRDLDQLPLPLQAHVLRSCGSCRVIVGDHAGGIRFFEESLALYRALGDARGSGIVLQRLGWQEAAQIAHPGRVLAQIEESLALHRSIGFAKGEAISLGALAGLERRAGNLDDALALLERSAVLARDSGNFWWQGKMLIEMAEVQLARGNLAEALDGVYEALPVCRTISDRVHMVRALAILARIAAAAGESSRAGYLWGAIEAEERRSPVGWWSADRQSYAQHVLALGDPQFESSRRRAWQLPFEAVLDDVLETAR